MLQLIAEGSANKQIAFELGISIKTVEKHRQHLMQKLSIHDIAGLPATPSPRELLKVAFNGRRMRLNRTKVGLILPKGKGRGTLLQGQRPPSEFELIKNRVLEGVSIKGPADLLMTVSAVDCSMAEKTEKEKHKRHLQHDSKRLAAQHDKRETTEHNITPYPDILPPLNSQHLLIHRSEGGVGVLAQIATLA